jgi:NADPH2:quinone reductase
MNTIETTFAGALRGSSLRVLEKAATIEALSLPLVEHELKQPEGSDILVEIHAAAVNPSDIKAATGLMPYAVFPRTPGRDFAGRVVAGEPRLIGKRVFGSSGDLGIRRDGSHATHMVVEAAAAVEVPENLNLAEAAGLGVPFVTASEGFRRAGFTGPGETVLILGLTGKVGQAAAQIATWRGAKVIGVVRDGHRFAGHINGSIEVIDSSVADVVARVRELTDGRGASLVFNTVGDPYYDIGTRSLAVLGRQIFIAAVHRHVTFDILAFYKGRHSYVGIDTIALDSVESGAILRELVPGFETGHLRPFPIEPDAVFPLNRAMEAYRAVIGGSRDRLILDPMA